MKGKAKENRDIKIYYLRSVQHEKYNTRQLTWDLIAHRVGLKNGTTAKIAWEHGKELWAKECHEENSP